MVREIANMNFLLKLYLVCVNKSQDQLKTMYNKQFDIQLHNTKFLATTTKCVITAFYIRLNRIYNKTILKYKSVYENIIIW